MSEKNNSFGSKKVSVWHIVYIVLICIQFIILVLLIAPGRINDDAYHNFSFAATITSIVLAVVSIVYSLQSGLSSLSHMGRIQDIEERISEELTKFSGIDEAIRQALSPINQKMGDLQRAQDSMTQKQDSLLDQVTKFNDTKVEGSVEQANGKTIPIVGPRIISVVLYAAICSKESGMDLPFHEFAQVVGVQARYCEGLLDGLAALHPDKLKVEQGTRSSRKKVTIFDEDYLGTKGYWKTEIEKIGSEKITKCLLKRIDDYYSDTNNQYSQDSI